MSDAQKTALDNRVLEIRSGSHLYGTSTPTSDEDFVGVFMPSEEYLFGFKNVEECKINIVSKDESGKNTKDAVDRTLHEFRRFCKLAMENNPNVLELMFVDEKNIVFSNDIGNELLSRAYLFPHKELYRGFVGYARAQKHKMIIKKDNYFGLLEGLEILDSLEDKMTMGQVYDTYKTNEKLGGLFIKKGTGVHIHIGDICFEPSVYVKKARAQLKERIDKATNRTELILKNGYDSKFSSHLIRLLHEGIELLETGGLQFPLKNADEIISIKTGCWTLEDILKYSDELEIKCEEAYKSSSLVSSPRFNEIEKFVIETTKSFIK
jgi:hypothetical protein